MLVAQMNWQTQAPARLAGHCYGNVNPDRAFTAEISDELMTPVAFTSNLKFDAVAV